MPDSAGDHDVVEVVIPTPDDWHVHLRDDEMLAAVVDHTARWFRYALVMPNLVPPIDTTAAAAAYRARILEATTVETHEFSPRMTLYLTDRVTIDDLVAGFEDGIVAGVKFYPAGATTNSESGGDSLLAHAALLERMADRHIPLLVHAESTDPEVDIFDREAVFLERQVAPLLDAIPSLRVTVEHISTAAGIALVQDHPQAAGSITPHHLAHDRSDLLANGMRPELYCKPVINSRRDRDALIAAATGGSPEFFLGTDSAPHPLSQKEARVARAGIFNAPYALQVTAEVFSSVRALDRFGDFVARHGAEWYGLEPSEHSLRLARVAPREAPIDILTTASGDEVRLFGVNEAASWSIERL